MDAETVQLVRSRFCVGPVGDGQWPPSPDEIIRRNDMRHPRQADDILHGHNHDQGHPNMQRLADPHFLPPRRELWRMRDEDEVPVEHRGGQGEEQIGDNNELDLLASPVRGERRFAALQHPRNLREEFEQQRWMLRHNNGIFPIDHPFHLAGGDHVFIPPLNLPLV
ncbi:hypothetical protein AB6A40_004680 [Gnathostoma spinigerum]|uniref:Uncharacterized protein n=1 Tax=Gnathostoma spinigerum TaxID=75299 RepID=A0ABD6EFI1_9BILA